MKNASTHHHDPSNTLDKEQLALLALHHINGIGSFLIRQLMSYCGSAGEVFRSSKKALLAIPHIGEASAQAIHLADRFEHAEAEWEKAKKQGVRILFFNDADFPQRLNFFDDSPSLLYLKGHVDLNAKRTVGIVGTRQATSYGKDMVEQLIEELVVHQPLVISGLAYGIDIHAHKQSLIWNLPTLGVMGSGIDIIYPAAHRPTAEKMIKNGGLITENALGKGPEAYHFPIRNRVIAGMSDVLIVVETAERGGALITAEIANGYGKDVFAVPGSTKQPYSIGCNKLIKQNKAHLLTTIKDLEYITRWDPQEASIKKEKKQPELSFLSAEEKTVMTLLKEKKNGMAIDELSQKSLLSPGHLASILLNLEFTNNIQSLPGKKYKWRH